MNWKTRRYALTLLSVLSLGAVPSWAQTAPGGSASVDLDAEDEGLIILDPFTVTTEQEGYKAEDTLGGARTRTKLIDTPSFERKGVVRAGTFVGDLVPRAGRRLAMGCSGRVSVHAVQEVARGHLGARRVPGTGPALCGRVPHFRDKPYPGACGRLVSRSFPLTRTRPWPRGCGVWPVRAPP